MKENKEYTLLDYEFSNGKKKLKAVLTYYNEIPKIDIREYYFNATEGEFKHSPKGVQLDSRKAEALRAALEQNATIIDKHLLSEDLSKWSKQIKKIETSSDFFSDFEFYKTQSTANKNEIIFNNNHPFGKKLLDIQSKVGNNEIAGELMSLIKCLLLTYNHSLSQFDEDAKTTIGDFLQDQNQTWSSLLKRLNSSIK